MNYHKAEYRKWLMTKVLIECWTLRKCARELGRSYTLVEKDFEEFNEASNSVTDTFPG